MARELIYDLGNPGFTIYHRAALGGLAATVEAWRKGTPPAGIEYELTRERVRLAWSDSMTDQDALRQILASSFRITKDRLIDVVGHGIPESETELRLAVHEGLCGTFLQHHKMRPSEPEARAVSIQTADGDVALCTYKGVLAYAHQHAQKTGLLEAPKRGGMKGAFPEVCTIPQWMVPGALRGARPLTAHSDEGVLLIFLMVGTSVFHLRPRTSKEKMKWCVVVPDVDDLRAFARALRSLASNTLEPFDLAGRYARRTAGGPAEAALRLLIDLRADDLKEYGGVRSVQTIAMGKVAWDPDQTNRSHSMTVDTNYPELAVFYAANTYLSRPRLIRGAKGEGYVVPSSPVPELVAANLAAGMHWADRFSTLVAEQKDFNSMRFAQKGLQEMKERIKDESDVAVIDMFQEAWHRRRGKLGERAKRDGLHAWSLIEGEQEQIRNEVLRAKTADLLAAWFLRFCADATAGGPLKSAQLNTPRLRETLFAQANTERLRNLFLFALLSYAKREAKTEQDGEP